MVFGLPKTNRERRVPLPLSVGKAVQAHMQDFPPAALSLPEHPAGERVTVSLVFTSTRRRPIKRSTFDDRAWKPALRRAGIEPTRATGMHALRHFYASALLDVGENIKAVSEYLGHTDPGFTLRVYTHLGHRGAAGYQGRRIEMSEVVEGRVILAGEPAEPARRPVVTSEPGDPLHRLVASLAEHDHLLGGELLEVNGGAVDADLADRDRPPRLRRLRRARKGAPDVRNPPASMAWFAGPDDATYSMPDDAVQFILDRCREDG